MDGNDDQHQESSQFPGLATDYRAVLLYETSIGNDVSRNGNLSEIEL